MANKSLKKQYQKEVQRIKSGIRKAEKRGWIINKDIILDIPKRVTRKALEKIKSLKPKQLYQSEDYVDKITGEILGKEEIHQRNIERGKKAWKTRQTKAEPQNEIPIEEPQQYYPTLSMIDSIRSSLQQLERSQGEKPMQIEARKVSLINIFEDTVLYYDDNLEELNAYLKQHEEEIATLMNVIKFDSNDDQVDASFAQLGRLLNVQALSVEQAESLSRMTEYYSK